jgi:ribosomal protein S18 acetylase RimI-like enzyme
LQRATFGSEGGFLLDSGEGVALNYRPYTRADFDELYGIEEICFQPPERFPRRYLRRLLESADSATWMAEEDGRIAGFAVADCGRRDEGGPFAYIETIEVLPEMRGRGIGGELLRRIDESARERGAGAIWLHVESQNAGAIRLYEAHGYVCEGRRDNYYADGRAGLIFRKTLKSQA